MNDKPELNVFRQVLGATDKVVLALMERDVTRDELMRIVSEPAVADAVKAILKGETVATAVPTASPELSLIAVMEALKKKYRVSTGSNFDQYFTSVGSQPAGNYFVDGETFKLHCGDLKLRHGWTGADALRAFNRNRTRRSMTLAEFMAAVNAGFVKDGWYFLVLGDGRVVDVRLRGVDLYLILYPAGSDWRAFGDDVFPSVGK